MIIKYAQGYRFDTQSMDFVKTGAIFLKTSAKKSEVYINQKFVDTTSLIDGEFTKRLLLPDVYAIEVKKDGRQTWRKRIQVKPSEVSQFLSIYLPPEILEFKQSELTDRELLELIASHNTVTGKYMLNSKDKRIYRLNKDNQLEDVEPDIQRIISSSSLVFSSQYKFWEIGFGKGDFVFVISKTYSKSLTGSIFVLENNDWRLISDNAMSASLSEDQNKIAVLGRNEISVYWVNDESIPPYYRKGQIELIVRRSDSVSRQFWFGNEHLLFLSGQNVFVVELDPRDNRNTFKLVEKITDFYYAKDTSSLVVKKSDQILTVQLN